MVSSSVPAIQQQLHVLVSQDVQPLDGFTAVYKCMLHVSLKIAGMGSGTICA